MTREGPTGSASGLGDLAAADPARCQPDRDITVVTHARGSDLDPSTREDGYTAKWGVDATAKPSLAAYTPRHRVPADVLDRLRLEDYLP